MRRDSRLPRSASLILLAVLGCTTTTNSEREPSRSDVSSERAPSGDGEVALVGADGGQQAAPPAATLAELGSLLGELATREVEPDRYAVDVRFSQYSFITREHTIDKTIEGVAVVELDADGSARICVELHDRSTSKISHYQARDGKDHESGHDRESLRGLSGSWSRLPGRADVELRLDRRVFDSCEVPADARPLATPSVLHCFGVAPNRLLATPALLCRIDGPDDRLAALALLLADHPRAGAWALREDPTRRDPETLPAGARPWLLLGSPGLKLRSSEQREQPTVLGIEDATIRDPKPRAP